MMVRATPSWSLSNSVMASAASRSSGSALITKYHRPSSKLPKAVFRVDLDLELALGGLLHLLLQELGSLIGEAARRRGVGQDQTAGLWLSGHSAGCGGEAVKEIGPLSPAGTAGQYGKTQYSRH